MHVFFVQLEPDIDHFSPVIYKLAVEGESVMVVSTNVLWNIDSDYRLEYLKKHHRVKVHYIYQVHRGLFLKLRLIKMLLWLPAGLLRLIKRCWSKIYFSSIDLNIEELSHFFKSEKVKTITFDPGQPQKIIDVIKKAASKQGIPTVNLWNGHNAYLPDSFDRVVEEYSKPSVPEPWMDENYFSPQWRHSNYTLLYQKWGIKESCLADNRLKIFGSPRYCIEWYKVNSDLLRKVFPGRELPSESNKLKVLILTRPNRGFSVDHPTIEYTKKLNYLSVICKTKPRTTLPRKCYDYGIDKFPTARLIQWADIIVCSVTGVIVDALYHNKIVIYLKYIAPQDYGEHEIYNACWKVESKEELFAALEILKETPDYRPYSSSDVNRFFVEAIYNGKSEKYDVLGAYSKFYREIGDSFKLQ